MPLIKKVTIHGTLKLFADGLSRNVQSLGHIAEIIIVCNYLYWMTDEILALFEERRGYKNKGNGDDYKKSRKSLERRCRVG